MHSEKVKKKRLASRLLKIFLFVIVLLLIAAGGLFWYWKTHTKEIIRGRLEKKVLKESDGLYRLKITDLTLDEKLGILSFTGLSLAYDKDRYEHIRSRNEAPPMLINIRLKELKITGIKSTLGLRRGKIHGNVMEIREPVIDILYTYHGESVSRYVPTREEIFKEIAGGLDLELDSMLIRDAKIRTISLKTNQSLVEGNHVFVTLAGVKMNKHGLADKTRLFFSRSFLIEADSINWSSGNKLYNYQLDKVSVSSVSREITLREFSINPLRGEDAFMNAIQFQDDRIDFKFSGITVKNFDPNDLLDENLRADELRVNSTTMKIYRDLNKPRDNKNRVGYYPHQLISRIPFLFTINKILIPGAYLEYKEKSAITQRPGIVKFNNTNFTFSNFTNDSVRISKNNIAVADFDSRFLNQTLFRTNWIFYLGDPDGKFTVNGNMGPIDGQRINTLLEPMGPAMIEKGYFDGLMFNMRGDNYSMKGSVRLLYHDLKVAMLEKRPLKEKANKKMVSSFFVNMLIKNDNPGKKESIRVSQVNNSRDTNRSFFNFCWKTLFKGLQQSVGISQ